MVNAEIKAKTKIINANFFHIKYSSFRIYLLPFTLLDGRSKKFIQSGILEKFPFQIGS